MRLKLRRKMSIYYNKFLLLFYRIKKNNSHFILFTNKDVIKV
jgi:hypothetical protein